MFFFMMIACSYGVFQLAVLGSFTRSVRMATLLLAVTAGLYGCGAVALTLEFLYTRAAADISGGSLADTVRTASYTVDPVIEEVVKVLPLLILALFPRIRAQWSRTDYLLLGAGIGGGFSLVEGTLRWGHQASNAVGNPLRGWTIGGGLFGGGQHIPGPFDILRSWLPAPVSDANAFFLNGSVGTDAHLAWSALAGFGVGLLIRGRGWPRWLGLAPWLYSILDHMASNRSILTTGSRGIWFWTVPILGIAHALWLLPLLALVIAGLLDRPEIVAGKAALPDALLPAEHTGQNAFAVLSRFAGVGLPWTPFLAMRYALLRRSLFYARTRNAVAAAALHQQVRAVRVQIERATDPAVWRALSVRRKQATPVRLPAGWRRRYWQPLASLILAIPALLFLIVGGFPATSGLQRLFTTRLVFDIVTAFSGLALLMVAYTLVRTVRGFPSAFSQAYADPAVSVTLRSGVAAGSLSLGVLTFSNVLRGGGATSPVVSNAHILDAISMATNILAMGLFALVLMAAFVGFMGGTGGLGAALVAAVADIGLQQLLQMVAIAGIGTLGALGLILMMATGGGSTGGGSTGGGSGSGEGSGSGDDPGGNDPEKNASENNSSENNDPNDNSSENDQDQADRDRREQYDDKDGDDYDNDQPRNQRMSDGNKMELEDSGWLKDEVPDPDTRRQFMDWLERGHNIGEEHVHLRPGSPQAVQALEQFFQEYPELRP